MVQIVIMAELPKPPNGERLSFFYYMLFMQKLTQKAAMLDSGFCSSQEQEDKIYSKPTAQYTCIFTV